MQLLFLKLDNPTGIIGSQRLSFFLENLYFSTYLYASLTLASLLRYSALSGTLVQMCCTRFLSGLHSV